jgi:glycosyltransferase involved in cell wall biosynthesis
MSIPHISVIMPAFNAEKTIVRAGLCILRQSHSNLRLHIIDDGSTDGTWEEANKLIHYHDSIDWKPRYLTVLSSHHPNQGIADSLNEGLLSAMRYPDPSEYIARMDADDLCSPCRLERQMGFMQKNDLSLCGTWAHIVDKDGNLLEDFHPVVPDGEDRKWIIKFNYLIHGSVMIRAEVLKKSGFYSKDYHPIDEYDLWMRIAEYGKIGVIPEYLYTLTRNESSWTATRGNEIYNKAKEIREHWSKVWGLEIPEHDLPNYNTRRDNA